MKVVFLGLSISSSWGNGHATNYRALARELSRRGHQVSFYERDVPWYAAHRDLPRLAHGTLCLYRDLADLRRLASADVQAAELVIQGSYVPEGATVADWLLETAAGLTAFYDIDTPITVEKLASGDREYLGDEQVSRFDLYLSFTGGPLLEELRDRYGARRPMWFPCLVDPHAYHPLGAPPWLALGYLGTYSDDRQPTVDALLGEVARRRPRLRFAVAGSSYPAEIDWPCNVERIEHLPPAEHPRFYGAQRFALNVTRQRMRATGFSPSVRLFEAAACGTPIISDRWPGLDEVLTPGAEILVADNTEQVLAILDEVDEERRMEIADRARRRVLSDHTAARRVDLLESVVRTGAGAAPAGSWP
jgi:spore maturation protein CgeB